MKRAQPSARPCACPDCSNNFLSRRRSQIYCSRECRKKDQQRRYAKTHRAEVTKVHREWVARHPGYQQDRRLRNRYGITQQQKEERIAKQGGKCAACGTMSPGGHGWCSDHNHETGELRDELCPRCNVVLGMVDENIEILMALMAYVRKWS